MEKVRVGTKRAILSLGAIYISIKGLCRRNTIKLRAPLILVSRPLASREFVHRRSSLGTDKAEFTRGADGPRCRLPSPVFTRETRT